MTNCKRIIRGRICCFVLQADREARGRRSSNCMIFDDDYRYWSTCRSDDLCSQVSTCCSRTCLPIEYIWPVAGKAPSQDFDFVPTLFVSVRSSVDDVPRLLCSRPPVQLVLSCTAREESLHRLIFIRILPVSILSFKKNKIGEAHTVCVPKMGQLNWMLTSFNCYCICPSDMGLKSASSVENVGGIRPRPANVQWLNLPFARNWRFSSSQGTELRSSLILS